MNILHRWFCSSSLWKKVVGERILPWARKDSSLDRMYSKLARAMELSRSGCAAVSTT
jgi:hypothetical protein